MHSGHGNGDSDGKGNGARAGDLAYEAEARPRFTPPPDVIADPYTLPIEPDALPGEYTLLVGMTIGEQRLEIHTADGQPAGNQLELVKVKIKPTGK